MVGRHDIELDEGAHGEQQSQAEEQQGLRMAVSREEAAKMPGDRDDQHHAQQQEPSTSRNSGVQF